MSLSVFPRSSAAWTAAAGVAALSMLGAIAIARSSSNDIDGFVARWHGTGAEAMPYRLFTPDGYDAKKKYPLIIWLHGAGGAGRDNQRQILDDQRSGTRTWTNPATQAAHPAFVVVPQSPQSWAGPQGWETTRAELSGPLTRVLGVLDELQREFSIDPTRIYVAGQSDGGFAVWDLITRRPGRFAAAIVLCGGGDPTYAPRAASTPTWVFHGDMDTSVPVTASRQMVAAVRKAGGQPRYTEYQGAGHDIWTRVFAEPGLTDWLFAQHK